MKKLFGKVKNFCAAKVFRAKTAFESAKAAVCRTKAVLACNRAEGFVDTAVKILMAVVIGALVLAGLYLLFSGTILPELTRRIQEMFNYGG
jgi:hypothetical protein